MICCVLLYDLSFDDNNDDDKQCGFTYIYDDNRQRWLTQKNLTTNTVGDGRAPPVHPLLRDLYLQH